MLPYTSAFEVSNTEDTSSACKSVDDDEESSVHTPHTVPRMTPGQWLQERPQEDEETTVDVGSVDRFQIPEHHVISTPEVGVETPRDSQRGLPDGSPMWAKRHLEQTGNINVIEDELFKKHLLKAPARSKSFMSADRKTSEEEHQRFLVSGGNLHLELDTQPSSAASSVMDQPSSPSYKVSRGSSQSVTLESPAYNKTLISEGDSALREAMEDNLAAEATVALDSMLNSFTSSDKKSADGMAAGDSIEDGLSDCDPAATQASTQGLRVSPFYDSTSAVVNENTFTLGNESAHSPNMMSVTSPRTSESSGFGHQYSNVNNMNTAVVIQPPQINSGIRAPTASPLAALAPPVTNRPMSSSTYGKYMSSQVSSHRESSVSSSQPSSYLEEEEQVQAKDVAPPLPSPGPGATGVESESYTSDDIPSTSQNNHMPATSQTLYTHEQEKPTYIMHHDPPMMVPETKVSPVTAANSEARRVLRRVKRTLKDGMNVQHELELLKCQRKQLVEQEEALAKEHEKLEKWNEELGAAELSLQAAQAQPDPLVEELAADEDEIKALQEEVETLKDEVEGVRSQITNHWVDINREKQKIAKARAEKAQREEERRRKHAEREAAKARFVPMMKDCGSTPSYALTNINSQIF